MLQAAYCDLVFCQIIVSESQCAAIEHKDLIFENSKVLREMKFIHFVIYKREKMFIFKSLAMTVNAQSFVLNIVYATKRCCLQLPNKTIPPSMCFVNYFFIHDFLTLIYFKKKKTPSFLKTESCIYYQNSLTIVYLKINHSELVESIKKYFGLS